MARNYVPPVVMAAELFVDEFVSTQYSQVIEYVLTDAVNLRGDPEPTCLLDLVYLWLQAGKYASMEGSTAHPFDACPTYESYLMTVMVITDMWLRVPERFAWPEDLRERYVLGPITELYPALPEEDVPSDWMGESQPGGRNYTRGEMTVDLMLAQYDHPALRRDSWEHWREVWSRRRHERQSSRTSS